MRSVLIVFGIAIGILVVAILFTPSKGLVDNPADEAYRRQQEYDRKEQEEARKARVAESGTKDATAVTQGALTAVMTVEGKGPIGIELYPKAAPKTVAQFTDLVKSKFYDGIRFHRVIADFMAQAGDPGSKTYTDKDIAEKDDGQGSTIGLGASGSGKTIPFEENPLKNEAGTLAMGLTTPHSDTADSQFFINFKHNTHLDGDYCVFGKVKSGMNVVNQLKRGDKIASIVMK